MSETTKVICDVCWGDPCYCETKREPLPVDSPSAGCVFSGEASKPLWDEINALDGLSTGDDIREVLYSFGCAMQELEAKLTHNTQRHLPLRGAEGGG